MAITIELHLFNKKPNSTAKPTNNIGDPFKLVSGYLLDGTSIINPVITFEQNNTYDIRDYNYAYISTFNRYYFITNITTDNNLWIVSMSVDVLASYKADIIASSQYVLRSASASDEDIVDKMYITKPLDAESRAVVSTYNSGAVFRNIISGGDPAIGSVYYFDNSLQVPVNAVCFGVVSGDGVGADYYVCTESNFITFMNNVFATVPSNMGNLAEGLKKLLADLEQYIVSVVRLPVMPHSSNLGNSISSIKLGPWPPISFTGYTFIPGHHYEEYFLGNNGITLPVHPNASVHSYYKLPPFTTYYLDFFPMGSIPLDAARLYGKDKVSVKWRIDYITGLALFYVGYENTSGTQFYTMYTDIAQVGIPIPLSQLKVDNLTGFGLAVGSALSNMRGSDKSPIVSVQEKVAGIEQYANEPRNSWHTSGSIAKWATNTLGAVNESVKNTFHNVVGNFVDTNVSSFDQIIDYAGNLFGDIVTRGSTGSYINIVAGTPSVRAFFVGQADTDNARFGSPLYAVKTLSTLSGFCVCQNATISIDATRHPLPIEIRNIIKLLNSGFYLE